jgi:hypothetical protein
MKAISPPKTYCQNPTTEDTEKIFFFREFKNGYSLPLCAL